MPMPHAAGRLRGACAAAVVLALAACGGAETAVPDAQANAGTESAAQAHDVSAQTLGFDIQRFTIKTLGEAQDHVAAGLGAAGLDEAEVPRGDAGDRGELELAHPAGLAPGLQQAAELGGAGGGSGRLGHRRQGHARVVRIEEPMNDGTTRAHGFGELDLGHRNEANGRQRESVLLGESFDGW